MRIGTKKGKAFDLACRGVPLYEAPALLKLLARSLDKSGYSSMIVNIDITWCREELSPPPPEPPLGDLFEGGPNGRSLAEDDR